MSDWIQSNIQISTCVKNKIPDTNNCNTPELYWWYNEVRQSAISPVIILNKCNRLSLLHDTPTILAKKEKWWTSKLGWKYSEWREVMCNSIFDNVATLRIMDLQTFNYKPYRLKIYVMFIKIQVLSFLSKTEKLTIYFSDHSYISETSIRWLLPTFSTSARSLLPRNFSSLYINYKLCVLYYLLYKKMSLLS